MRVPIWPIRVFGLFNRNLEHNVVLLINIDETRIQMLRKIIRIEYINWLSEL